MGGRAPAISTPRQFAPGRSSHGPGERAPLRHSLHKNFLGRATAADLSAAAVLCLPLLVITFVGWIWSLLRENE